ncbi:MAG: hypothetical protein JWR26_1923 [Pedosphaera sp.]|nr:hypothetical protein [Pedosphaera sp.]
MNNRPSNYKPSAFKPGITINKEKSISRIVSTALAAMLPITAYAQEKAATSAATVPSTPVQPATNAPSAGLVNDWLREQSSMFSPWDIGGQFRARLEVKDFIDTPGQAGQVAFRHEHGDANNTYLLLRQKLHVGYNDNWFTTYIEGQESSSTGDKRNPNLESDQFDLHQGYVTLGNLNEFPVLAKVGRQELSYGDERLIGAFDWNNIGRSFDAAKLRYVVTAGSWVDAFTSYVVVPRDNHFDFPNNYDAFSGVYASSRDLIPWQETQLYFLVRNVSHNSPNLETGALVPLASPRDIYTPGFRVKSLPGKLHGFDYGLEAAYQFGRFEPVTGVAPTAVTGRNLKQEAYMVHAEGGYAWATSWFPRVGLEFNYASGDKNPNDDTHGTFDTLFPTTHAIVGILDLYSLQNIEDLRINFGLKPTKKFTVFSSFRGVWLATPADSFYLANQSPRTGGTPGGHNGYALNPTYDRFVGTEADLVLTYNFTSYAQVQGGYSHFFVGNYVKQSLSAPGFGSTDANYLYLQTTFRF